MAKAPKAAPTRVVDPAASYRVVLKVPVRIKPTVLARPGDDVVVTGAVLQTIFDKIASFEPV